MENFSQVYYQIIRMYFHKYHKNLKNFEKKQQLCLCEWSDENNLDLRFGDKRMLGGAYPTFMVKNTGTLLIFEN